MEEPEIPAEVWKVLFAGALASAIVLLTYAIYEMTTAARRIETIAAHADISAAQVYQVLRQAREITADAASRGQPEG